MMNRKVRDDTAARRRANRRGHAAELIAAAMLLAKGYRLLSRRHRTPVGEIDLVARRGEWIVFVEVKRRRTLEDGIEAITRRQRQRLRAAAAFWQSQSRVRAGLNYRFDIVIVRPYQLPCHIQNAFEGG